MSFNVPFGESPATYTPGVRFPADPPEPYEHLDNPNCECEPNDTIARRCEEHNYLLEWEHDNED